VKFEFPRAFVASERDETKKHYENELPAGEVLSFVSLVKTFNLIYPVFA
jgi:hypothetical protein